MKTFKIPLAILIGMILLALLNGVIMQKQCRIWQEKTLDMAAQAERAQWDAAQDVLDELNDSWSHWSNYLRIITVHDEAETVDTILEECRVLLQQQNGDTLSLTAAQLNCQFHRLGELQSLSLSNLL